MLLSVFIFFNSFFLLLQDYLLVLTLFCSAEYKDKDMFKIHFKSPLQPGSETIVRIEVIYTHALIPYPSSVSQSDKQLVLYHGNHYYYSPYMTKTQTTVVTLPSSSTESFSKLKPVAHSDNLITYGPYENIPPFSVVSL